MKKTILLLLVSFCSYAQVYMFGASESYLNGSYTPSYPNPSMDEYDCISPSSPYSPYELYDTGTNIYSKTISMPGFSNIPAYIIRRNGQWNIEARDNNGGYKIFYRSVGTSTDVNPPCNATWEKWDSWCFSYGHIQPTSIYVTNINLSGLDCASCQTLSGVLLPEMVNFPILSEYTMHSLTANNGLREGSTVFNCTLNSLAVYDGCEWLKIKTESIYKPGLVHANMTASSSNQEVSFDWVHSRPSLVSQFILQYSTNNGPWVDYQTFPNTTFSYTNNNLASNTFNPNQTYAWRIKSIETCGKESYSCLKETYFPFLSNQANSYPVVINIDAPFTVGSGILIKMVSNNSGTGLTNWEYNLEYYDGYSWQNSQTQSLTISSFPHSFIIPGGNLLLDKKYRIRVKNTTNAGAAFHYIEFHYSSLQKQCD